MEESSQPAVTRSPRMLGRYEMLGRLASGGMATVYLARHRGEAGFQRLFAVKVLHEHLAEDEDFVTMLLDEARIAARLHHPNVVPIVDMGSQGGTHYVVMEYIEGTSLSALLKVSSEKRPPRLLVAIMLDVLAGLHAAHTLTDDDDMPMNLVHRDVSPQNVMVGVDGVARLTDFGVARAESRLMHTRPGQLKGKIAFMSPEQVASADSIDRRSDLFSAGAMLWSALTGRRLFRGDSDAATLANIMQLDVPPASGIGLQPPAALDAVIARSLARDREDRYQSAQQMEEELRDAATAAACLGQRREVAAWVKAEFGDQLEQRRKAIRQAIAPREPFDSQPSSTSFRSLPGVGGAPLSNPGSGTPTGSVPSIVGSPHSERTEPSVALSPMGAGDARPARGKAKVIALAVAALALVAGLAVFLLGQETGVPSEATAAAAEQPTATEEATAGPTTAEATAEPPEPVEAAEPAASSPAETKSAAPPQRPAPQPVGRPRVAAAEAPPPAPPTPAEPPPTPPPPKEPKQPALWDKDSPLPPP